jgi:hypothetical protein
VYAQQAQDLEFSPHYSQKTKNSKQNKKHGKECLVNVTGMASVCNGILPKI